MNKLGIRDGDKLIVVHVDPSFFGKDVVEDAVTRAPSATADQAVNEEGDDNPDMDAEEPKPAASDGVAISIIDTYKSQVFFKVTSGTSMEKLLEVFATRQGHDANVIELFFGGAILDGEDTAESVSPVFV